MKKMLLASFFLALFVLMPHALAQTTQGFVPLAPIPGLTQGVDTTSAGLPVFFNNLYKYLIGLAAVLAVIEIIWGGLEISTKDSVSKQSDGRERITQAILGLILILSPVLVFSIINPSILNLSLNLPALDTKSSVSNQGSAQAIPCTSNCNTGATGGSVGVSQGTGMTLYACSGSDCSAAKTTCSDRTTSVVASAGGLYAPTVVCAQSGNIDPNGAVSTTGGNGDATSCKAGESLVVNCIFTMNQ